MALAGGASAEAASLYSGPAPRPGPEVLYQPPAQAPQLSNAGIWNAKPILVSGTDAYRGGEFLYQDFLYDDHGAHAATRDPGDPRSNAGSSSDNFSAPNGTYTYPTDPAYAMNAADLVELRVKPLSDATAFRITLNTMKDPELVGTTIAIGNSAAPLPFPHGANAQAPAQMFLTVHGSTADLLDAATGTPVGTAPTVTVDSGRRQIEVRVPHSDWNPGSSVVRLAAGVGLWDRAAGKYLTPGAQADATHPGGAAGLPNPTAFFNVAFRHTAGAAGDPQVEPYPNPGDSSSVTDPRWWRDAAQGNSLRTGDLTPFHADVDFAKLAAGTNDDMTDQPGGTPSTGPMDRIAASHTETEQGLDYSALCGNSVSCKGEYRGRLQPYSIYIPRKAPPAGGFGLTLLMHSLGANYNQYLSTRNQSQFGERGPGSIVITPEGRGPDGWYYDHAGADTFEVWADAASHFKLDPAYTVATGYSMGGYGTYKFATQYPDLFAKGQPTVGPPGLGIWVPPADPQPGGAQSNTYRQLASLRNIPFLIWNATTDELVPFPGAQQQARGFDGLGYRYEFDVFQPADHLTLAINDQFQPAADFLGSTKVDRDPAHVTFVRNPTMDFASLGTTADHAYWLSKVDLRNGSGAAPLGTIDVRSGGFGQGDPTPSATKVGGGALTGGNLPAISFTSQARSWGPVPKTPVANRLDVHATNISSVTVNVKRARVNCHVALNVTSDGPLAIKLAGCNRTVRVSGKPRLSLRVRYGGVRCGAATATLAGADVRRVRRVDFVARGRRIARDGRAPFRARVARRPRSFALHANVRMRDGRRVTLTRSVRGCVRSGPRFTG